MDALLFTAGTLVSLYTIVEVAGLLLRTEPPARCRVQRTNEFRRAEPEFAGAFHTAAGGTFTIDLEPIPGRQANYYG